MNRKLRAVDDGDGYRIVDEADGSTVDWINRPRVSDRQEGDTDSYVVIAERPDQWSEDMRWMVTPGQRVRQSGGLNEGRIGTITGQARSRKADRMFGANIASAARNNRPLTDEDFEILIDNEGPLITFDGETAPEWFPGQSFTFEPVS